MAIQSMTGFGKGESSDTAYTVNVEIKSVNNRFKEVRAKIPYVFNPLEIEIKKRIGEKFNRGSFDIFINYRRAEGTNAFDDLDHDKINQFINTVAPLLAGKNFDVNLRPTDFLRSEFFKDKDLSNDESLKTLMFQSLDKALNELEKARAQEGEKLIEAIKNHLAVYRENFSKIENLGKEFENNVRERLLKRFSEYQNDLKIDEGRFMQEIVFYLEKIDIHEEIDRVHSHLKKIDSILIKKGEVGREIDFLLQEFGRETNTMGSKSSLNEITDSVVKMKVCLEKIREQALNLE